MTPCGVIFSKKNARYLRSVLRLKVGDLVSVFNGLNSYNVALTVSSRERIQGEIVESGHEGSGGIEICLAFGCVRPGPVEEILRHGTELGVSVFIPLISGRANRKPQERKVRWNTIVESASAQSGRITVPEVETPVSFDQFLQRDFRCDTGILLSTDPNAEPFLELLRQRTPGRVMILVGPEGGFDSAEQSGAIGAGFLPVRLCSNVLRTETAALVAVGAVGTWYDALEREERHAFPDLNTNVCVREMEQSDKDVGLT
jgi:16S rRNA (uracil1498-N3)-methyltransferase